MNLGDNDPRDRGYCPICSRLPLEMDSPGILVTEVNIPRDRTDDKRHLGLPPGYDVEDWPFPTLLELSGDRKVAASPLARQGAGLPTGEALAQCLALRAATSVSICQNTQTHTMSDVN
jgi:hypothetical protein